MIPANLLCLIFVLVTVLISQAGMHIYTLYFESKTSPQNNEVVGIIFGAISVLYSLVLAFVFLAVWGDYEDLSKTIADETDKLNNIMAHSSTLPNSIQEPIKNALISYCNQVIDEEWNMKQLDAVDSPSAIPSLRMMLLQLEPQTKSEANIYAVLDEDLSNISDLRRNRLSHSQSGVPEIVWFILQVGSSVLIIFYYFLNVPSANLKRLYLVFLSGYIAMCMFLVYALDRPFTGRVQVSRQPYANILTILKQDYALTQKQFDQ